MHLEQLAIWAVPQHQTHTYEDEDGEGSVDLDLDLDSQQSDGAVSYTHLTLPTMAVV